MGTQGDGSLVCFIFKNHLPINSAKHYMIYSAFAFSASLPWHNNHPELLYYKSLTFSTQENRPLVCVPLCAENRPLVCMQENRPLVCLTVPVCLTCYLFFYKFYLQFHEFHNPGRSNIDILHHLLPAKDSISNH